MLPPRLMRAALPLLLACTSAGASAGTAPVNLVVNGDFEASTPAVSGWQTSVDLLTQRVDYDYSSSATPHAGLVYTDGSYATLGWLRQSLPTVAGARYTLEFDLLRTAGSDPVTDNQTQLWFGTTLLLDDSNVSADWTHVRYTGLLADGAATLLQFGLRSGNADDPALDNISVVLSPVPEPASAALLLAGLAVLAQTRRGRVPMHLSTGVNDLGRSGGSARHTLRVAEMPAHTHTLCGSAVSGHAADPAGRVLGATEANGINLLHVADGTASLHPAALANSGQNQPHNNLQPYLTTNFIIALVGTYPTRP